MSNPVTLDLFRQVAIGNAIADTLAEVRPVPIVPTTQARAEAVVEASATLQFFNERSSGKVDHATDTVVTTLRQVLETCARGFRSDVVPLQSAQRDYLDRCVFLQGQLYPKGTDYVLGSMNEQWPEMVTLRTTMLRPDVAAAIDAVGLRPMADHVLAHIGIYGRMLGKEAGAAGGGLEEATGTWNRSMKLYIAQVEIDYESDPVMRRELLGAYEKQVELQRAGYRAKKAQAGEPAPPPPPAPAPAPEPAPAPDGDAPAAS